MSTQVTIDPKLDFVIERFIDAPTRLVWEALTKPEHLKEWYMPRAWGRVARVDVDSAGTATDAGARVGDAEADVQRAYGGRAVVTPHKYETGHYLTVTDAADSAFALVFETRGGTVTRYRAGRRPQVEYVEGCG